MLSQFQNLERCNRKWQDWIGKIRQTDETESAKTKFHESIISKFLKSWFTKLHTEKRDLYTERMCAETHARSISLRSQTRENLDREFPTGRINSRFGPPRFIKFPGSLFSLSRVTRSFGFFAIFLALPLHLRSCVSQLPRRRARNNVGVYWIFSSRAPVISSASGRVLPPFWPFQPDAPSRIVNRASCRERWFAKRKEKRATDEERRRKENNDENGTNSTIRMDRSVIITRRLCYLDK